MSWTVDELRDALGDLVDLGDAEAAERLAAERTSSVQNVQTSDARALLLKTGEWGAVVLLSRKVPADAEEGMAVAAAITAQDTLRYTETLEATDPGYFAAMERMCAVLSAAGVVSAETCAALLDLRNVSAPVWVPAPTAADVAAARAMED